MSVACPQWLAGSQCAVGKVTVSLGFCQHCLAEKLEGRHLIVDPTKQAALAHANGDASHSNRKGGCAGCN